jgi:hypothetical protein
MRENRRYKCSDHLNVRLKKKSRSLCGWRQLSRSCERIRVLRRLRGGAAAPSVVFSHGLSSMMMPRAPDTAVPVRGGAGPAKLLLFTTTTSSMRVRPRQWLRGSEYCTVYCSSLFWNQRSAHPSLRLTMMMAQATNVDAVSAQSQCL